MQKQQAQIIVKETFQNAFDKERFIRFIKELLNHVEPASFVYRGNLVPDAYEQHISSLERIGKYTDGEHEVDILIVKLKKTVSIERARTMQRNFIAWYLNGSRGDKMKDAALVAFVSPDEQDWRFSLVKMEYKFEEGKNKKMKVREEFTPAKRWSFLVGVNENSHTAQSRLAPIVEDDEHNPTLQQLEEAFNIEKVTKEFFEKYRDLFLRVSETLEGITQKDGKLKKDFALKNVSIADFTKKLLGQIVFLYFLQKKGWFGVPMNKVWGEGDKKFIRTLFEKAQAENKNYFNDFLEPLFYEALAKERDEDFYSRFESKIPFLNGGLFDPISNYDWVNTVIGLPDDLFSNTRKTKQGDVGDGILDIFDRYNFTVKEDEPLEKEVAVDPEMLGKVFENLLEVKDRKSKGTYYTPREIVHYMCEQSLINYLATELEGKVPKDAIEQLVQHGETVAENEAFVDGEGKETPTYYYKLPESIRDHAEDIDAALATIKVCDPAIGSGAFPVGMMGEIVKARAVLSAYLKDSDRTVYNFKRDCIQNSLYGVDIDPGAVEIAKLRLWLSLVVDEDDIKQIKPLPNLDYKIMQGNSLLEEFEGVKLFDEKLLSTPIIDARIFEKDNQKISELQSKLLVFYKDHPEWLKKKKVSKPQEVVDLEVELRALLQKTKHTETNNSEQRALFTGIVESKQIRDELAHLHKKFFEETNKNKKDQLRKQIDALEWQLIEATLREEKKTPALEKLKELKNSKTKPFFLWKLHFSDVFESKGGFDIVIANPPYVRVDEIDDSDKTAYKQLFITASGKYDLYYLFFEKSFQLLSSKGFCIFISPNKYCAADSAIKLRKLMLESMFISEILSTSKLKIFDEASNYPVVSSLSKTSNKDEKSIIRQVTEMDRLYEKRVPNVYFAEKEDFAKLPNSVIPINATQTSFKLIQRLYESRLLFSNIISISEGLRIPEKFESKEKQGFAIVKQYQFSKYSKIKEGGYISKDNLSKVVSNNSDRYQKLISKKILIMEDALQISATLDENKMVPQGGVYFGVCLEPSANIYFIAGILNSRLLSFVYETLYAGMHMGGGYLRYRSKFLESLPITERLLNPESRVVDLISKSVNQILSLSKIDNYESDSKKQVSVRIIENRIDEVVYELYGLTNKEIELIGRGQ